MATSHPTATRRLIIRFVAVIAGFVTGLMVSLTAGLAGARAAESGWIGDPQIGEARLISAVTATGDLGSVPLAIEFTLAAGWKVYWRTPGEAGLAPVIDLSASPNPDLAGRISWPLPTRFDAFGFDNFGYANEVILPLELAGHVAGAPLQIIADLDALVCADICVPFGGRLEMMLPGGPAMASSHAQAMAQYAAMVPRPATGGISASGPSLRPVRVEARPNGLYIRLADGAPPIADIFVEAQDDVAFKAPEPSQDGMFLEAVPADKLAFGPAPVTLTISAPPEMAEFQVAVTKSGAVSAGEASAGGVAENMTPPGGLSWRIIALALLGGLILNLMPCVLPVLALKLAAVLDAVGAPRRELRLRFLAGAAGILTSFVVLAAGLALLRVAGGTVGWGVQFQNPVFLVVMMVMLGVFALSLVDLVMIPVPRFAQGFAGGGQGGSRPYRGDFMAGMLATVLATPCSAPFVGTAVAVALSGSMLDLFGVFIALGLGLAAPWILVALQPSLVGFLPRPGPWMPWLKRGLALLLLGTMIWLGSVLVTLLGTPPAATVADGETRWGVWSPAAVSTSLDEGRPVFVDVTADWCVTCKANKALVLDRRPVSSVMAAAVMTNSLGLLRADWTRPDDEIAAFLASYGRYGIPFNIILRPDGKAPIILPELLSDDAVLTALENAGVVSK